MPPYMNCINVEKGKEISIVSPEELNAIYNLSLSGPIVPAKNT